MATGDKYVAINTKRLLGFQDLRERFLDYVLKRVKDMHDNAFGDDGIFGGVPITMSVHSGNLFQLDLDKDGTDNDGHFLKTDAELAGRDIGIAFENSGAVNYDVGLHYTERPRGIQINPRTATPEYIAWEEIIGQRDNPDAVVDNTGSITFTVDSVCNPFDATKYPFAGRQCLVWPFKLDNGESVSEPVVIEQCIVTWDGSNNKITTVGTLGQPTGAVSTSATWYYVLLLGPTVCRNSIKDLETEPAYEFIGQVTGGTPPTFDTSRQNDLGVGYAVALNQITRISPLGDLKLRVTANSGDAGESQISVDDHNSIEVFNVNEAGDVDAASTGIFGGKLTADAGLDINNGDLTLLASFGKIAAAALTTLKVGIKNTTGIFRVEDEAAALKFSVNAAGDAIIGGTINTNGALPRKYSQSPDYEQIRYYVVSNIPVSTTTPIVTDTIADGDVMQYDVTAMGWGKGAGIARAGSIRKIVTIWKDSGALTIDAPTTVHDGSTTLNFDLTFTASANNLVINVVNGSATWAMETTIWIRETYMRRA